MYIRGSLRFLFQIVLSAILLPIVFLGFIPSNKFDKTYAYSPIQNINNNIQKGDNDIKGNNKKSPLLHMVGSDIQKKLDKSWNESLNKFDLNRNDWRFFDWFNTEEITVSMSEADKSNYLDSLTNSVNSVRQKGDLVPIVLVNRDITKTIVLFQRNEGEGKSVKVVLIAKKSKQGTNWVIESTTEK